MLGYRPGDWTPADSLVIGKLMALQLSGNYRKELLHARLAQMLSPSEIGDPFPEYPKDAPVTLSNLASLIRGLPLDTLLAALSDDRSPQQRASNNWVVDGAHSVTGRPLLANDPHLDFAAPLVWYLAPRGAEYQPDRCNDAGSAGGRLGHNNRIAWGFTTTNTDVEDVFVKRADPVDPRRYATPQGTAAFEVREEPIMVKGSSAGNDCGA